MSVIVVGVDGSETAATAARTAAELAVALGADLLIASAFPAVTPDHAVTADAPTARDAAEKTALDVAASIRALHPSLTVTEEAEPGKPGDALARVASAAGATLIVVGNKRVQGVSRILGNVAGEVVRKAPCDVYIAHTHG